MSETRAGQVWAFRAALIAIVLLGGLLRFHRLTERELWLDESCTSFWVHNFATTDDARSPWNEPAHVPYFFLLRLWTRTFGETDWGLRSFSAVVGSLTVGLLGVVATRIANHRVGLFVALLAAVHPLHIYYSQEARSYVLWVFAITAAAYFLIRSARKGRAVHWIGYVICTSFAFLTHYYTLFWIPTTLAAWFLAVEKRRLVRQWTVANVALCLLLLAPAWFWMRPYLQTGPTDWQRLMWESYPPWLAMPRSIWALLPSGGYPRAYLAPMDFAAENVGAHVGVWALVFLQWVPTALLFAMLGLLFLKRKSLSNAECCVTDRGLTSALSPSIMDSLKFAGVMSLGYLLIVWSCSIVMGRGYLVGRYDLAAWPTLMIALALLTQLACNASVPPSSPADPSEHKSKSSPPSASLWLSLAMLVVMSVCSLATWAGYRTEPVINESRERARRLAVKVQPADLVISVGLYRWFLDHEWRAIGFAPEVRSFPSWHDHQLCWRDVPRDLADETALDRDLDELMPAITTSLTSGRRVWLLWQPNPDDPTWQVDSRLLQALQEKQLSIHPEDEWVGLLELRPPTAIRPKPETMTYA